MLGTYEITTEKDEDGWFIARIKGPDGAVGHSAGSMEDEMWDMVADCIKVMYDIDVPWWRQTWRLNPLWWWRQWF